MKRKEFMKLAGLGAFGVGLSPMFASKLYFEKSNKEICKATWDKLCGAIGNTYKTDGFEYVHPKNEIPNVLLYGDSISIKYTSPVREKLKGKATVIRLFKNGGSSGQFISNMEKMKQTMFQPYLNEGWDFKWDIIHFNVGLHDLKYLNGKHLNKKGVQVSSIEEYKSNLKDICEYLKKEYPKVKLIFATTTPVPEGAKGRYEGDSVRYNKAALDVLKNYPEIQINDLYAFTMPHAIEWVQEPGNVHYNELGFLAQGEEVADVIEKNLA